MDHAVNRAPISHEMSTKGRGSMLEADRGSMIGEHGDEGVPGMPVGREARNASRQPASFMPGPQGDVGVMDTEDHGGA
jgi:hypothetical protein